MSNFQLTVIAGFIALLLIGVLIFAGILPGFRARSGGVGGTVTLWATIDEETMKGLLEPFEQAHRSEFTLIYEAKDARTFEAELINALAAGRGPDLVFLPSDWVVKQADKLLPLPYSSYSLAQFKKDFAPIGQLYLTPTGILGLPLYIDPLVLYSNQDLLTNAKLAIVPGNWDEILAAVKSLSRVDPQKNLTQSTIALGQWGNIANAKDVLSLLILQAGNPITARNENGVVRSVLKERYDFPVPPAAEALGFFNRFAEPDNTLYSWNSALPEARQAFLRGTLALYLGAGSDWPRLKRQNPQLNFDINPMPQRVRATAELTFGRAVAVGVVKASKNPATAWQAAILLSGPAFAQPLADALFLPPVRKDLLAKAPADPAMTVLYQSAIIARGWLDPDPAASVNVFRRLVEDSANGRLTPAAAVERAGDELQLLIK